MCAAPGSKTAQLIEMLHADMNVPFPSKFGQTIKNLWDFKFSVFFFLWITFNIPESNCIYLPAEFHSLLNYMRWEVPLSCP